MSELQQPTAPAQPATPQEAQQAAQQTAQAAQQAAQQAQEAAGTAEDAAPFQIQGSDGKSITLGSDGIKITQPGQSPPASFPEIPQEAMIISISFFVMIVLVIVGWPIARAIARRMDRGSVAPVRVPADQTEQLRRIEQAVEAMAIEVERVSENQRFVTKLLSEGQPEGALLSAAERGRGVVEHATPEVNTPR